VAERSKCRDPPSHPFSHPKSPAGARNYGKFSGRRGVSADSAISGRWVTSRFGVAGEKVIETRWNERNNTWTNKAQPTACVCLNILNMLNKQGIVKYILNSIPSY